MIDRRRLLASLLAVGTTGCAGTPNSQGPRNRTTAFVDVTVIPAYGERHLRNHTVLVRAGRIVSLLPSSQATVPEDAIVIGKPHQIVAPGLADMHVHIFEPNDGILLLANGVTTVRNMSGRAATTELAARITSGDTPGPHIYSSGPILDTAPTGNSGLHTVDDIRRAVSETADAGYIGAKLYENLSRAMFVAGVITARTRGLQVYAHVPLAMTLDEVLSLHIDSVEHMTGFDRALAPRSHSHWDEERWSHADIKRITPLARRVADSGVWNAATLITLIKPPRAFAAMQAAEAAPEYKYLTPRVRALWRHHAESEKELHDPARAILVSEAAHRVRLQMLRALHTAGAPLLIGTDAPQPFVYPGYSLHEEFSFHRQAGLSNVGILRAATLDAARFLKQENTFAEVRAGARADLLLLDDDPEADFATLRRPAGVMAEGRWYDAPTLARLLERIAQRNEILPPL